MENQTKCSHTSDCVVKNPAQKQVVEVKPQGEAQDAIWRRHCGCIRTSEKLKQIITSFPPPPPPSPASTSIISSSCCQPFQKTYISAYRVHENGRSANPVPEFTDTFRVYSENYQNSKKQQNLNNKSWIVVTELVQLVQLSVTATALALYYLIYCYMQLIYFTLKSALYFHNADGPMKITIGVVTLTSLIIGINFIFRIETLMGLKS